MQRKKAWYEPLEAHFNGIPGAMSRARFAAIEAVLHLLLTNAPGADPRKAYLLLAQYQLIGVVQCTVLDHQLQRARYTLGIFRSRKVWEDYLDEYRDPKYDGFRAFSIGVDANGACAERVKPGYPYPYERRMAEWQRFWGDSQESSPDAPVAKEGKYLYTYLNPDSGNAKQVLVEFPGQPVTAEEAETPVIKGCREPIKITIQELLDCAKEMAQIKPGDYCCQVLQQNTIKQVHAGKVSPCQELDIHQVVNIVGMVGSGKSTLIRVLSFWAHENGKKMVIVVDTVAEVLNLWQYLRGFRIECSPLIGRSEWLKYINQITTPGESCLPLQLSQYMTNACIVDGMDDSRSDSFVFGKEPCYSLREAKGKTNYLCPYFDMCPGTRMLRECYSSSVVITTVAGFAASRVGKDKELFLEAAFNQADFVVFDEADRAQKTLDQLFMPETSFDRYINESAEGCRDFMSLPSQKRAEDRAQQRYRELQLQSPIVMSCVQTALRQNMGIWNSIADGYSFSALTLLESLRDDKKYGLSPKIYQALYRLIDQDDSSGQENPLWRLLHASCQSTDSRVFDQMYDEWISQESDSFSRGEITEDAHIQDSRIKLILRLIYFDHFIRDLSDAYKACHETSYGQNDLFSFLQSRFLEQQRILPSALCGNLFGVKQTDSEDIVLFRQYAFGRSLMNDLPYLRTDENGNAAGPHVILLSGSSWAEGSYEFHINRPVTYILEADQAKREFLRKTAFFESGLRERVSGAGDRRMEMLRVLTQKSVDTIIREYERNVGKILLVVNSYAQAITVQETLQSELRQKRCDAVVCRMISDASELEDCNGTIRRGEVSRFAGMPEAILIAPAMAIERGHNIVDETGHSALSAVFFMVRPMSVPDDIQEKGSKLNGYIESHYKRNPEEAVYDYNVRIRREAARQWAILNGSRAYGLSILNEEQQKDIVATLFILILQIFGRLARVTDTTKPAPRVYFMDGAFRRPEDRPKDFDCLEALGEYLDYLMNNIESAEIAKTLYEPFYTAYKEGIHYG